MMAPHLSAMTPIVSLSAPDVEAMDSSSATSSSSSVALVFVPEDERFPWIGNFVPVYDLCHQDESDGSDDQESLYEDRLMVDKIKKMECG
jgi:hypothetical protein